MELGGSRELHGEVTELAVASQAKLDQLPLAAALSQVAGQVPARAIQFFAPGIPQVYYVGLLAGQNDQKAVQETGEGRAINRHNYSVEEVGQAVQKPIVQRLLRLTQFRNGYPAFNGDLRVLDSNDSELVLAWQKADKMCRLNVDLNTNQAVIVYAGDTGEMVEYRL